MDIINPILNNEYLTEFIYKKSPLVPFIQSVMFDIPEFYLHTNTKPIFYKMEKFSVRSSFSKEANILNPTEELIYKMIDEAWWMLQRHYLNYIDKNAIVERFSFDKNAKIPMRLFRTNVRYSFIDDSSRIEHKKAINFLSMLTKSRDIFDDDEDESMYLITSTDIATYLSENPSINLETNGVVPQSNLIYWGGTISNDFQSPFILRDFPVFVNPSFKQNIAYIGTTKKYNIGTTLFYCQSKDVFTKRSDDYQIDLTLNLQYKFADINNVTHKFKKIIFEA